MSAQTSDTDTLDTDTLREAEKVLSPSLLVSEHDGATRDEIPTWFDRACASLGVPETKQEWVAVFAYMVSFFERNALAQLQIERILREAPLSAGEVESIVLLATAR